MAEKATKKTNEKKKRILTILGYIAGFLIISTLVCLIVASTGKDNNTNNANDNNNISKEEEKDKPTNDYDSFISVDSQGVLDLMSNGNSFFLYAGRESCPNCKVFVPILAETLRENSEFKVFYYDTEAANSNPDKKSETLSAIDVTGVPAFMYIKDGAIAEKLTDRSSKDSILAFLNKYRVD